MTRLLSAFNFQQWAIESDFPGYEKLEYLFDGLEDNRDSDQTTATNNGIQHYYNNEEIKDVADIVRTRTNELLAEQQSPVSAGELDHAWTITYNPGGWQALHSHSYRYNIISTILYFDTNESENTSNGALYSIFSEPDGDQLVQVYPYWAGKFVVMEGAIFHGAYPTTSTRRCLIIDFKQEIHDNTNTE
jgi:hypothetical protein|tara:strand:- start:166 stop:732 length:567 start_codon:yes stop_codon:yes gene_type:complete